MTICSKINPMLEPQKLLDCKHKETGVRHEMVCESTSGTSDEFQMCHAKPVTDCYKGATYTGDTTAATRCAQKLTNAGKGMFTAEKTGSTGFWIFQRDVYTILEQRNGSVAR